LHLVRFVVPFVLGALLAACSSLPERAEPAEYLDQRTGATVTVVDHPLVFARDRSERAANVRDYITAVASSINRAGKIQYLWVVYVWSTLDAQAGATTSAANVVITADDRRIALLPVGVNAVEAGISVPVQAPAHVTAISQVFATDLPTLRFVAAARSVRMQVSADAGAPYYELWDDQRESLSRFVRFASGER
jgi:hypothetical protein